MPSNAPELDFAQAMASARTIADPSQHQYASDGATLYEWVGTHWRSIDQQKELERMAWRYLSQARPDECTPRRASSCASAAILEANTLPKKAMGSEVSIPCLNGTVDVVRGEDGRYTANLRDSAATDGLTHVLNAHYDPTAAAPLFQAFMAEVQPDPEVRDFIQEYVGVTLLGDTRYQQTQIWLGGGANGKSAASEIFGGLHAQVAAMDLSNLTGFSLLPLVDASLVLVEETPNRIDEQQLKKLVGGSLVQVDRKYLSPISIRPKAKWLILANRLPSVSDQSLGFWRRMPVVPWPVTVPTHKRDPLLAKRIIENELAGVLVWALDGLVRVLERGRPAVPPKAVQAATQGGQKETNSVMAWVDYCEVTICAGLEREKSEVYAAYARWCRASGMGAVSAPKFWGRLADLLGCIPESRPRRDDGTRARTVGVQIGFEPDIHISARHTAISMNEFQFH